jgi:type II secretory pathway pseudopilin PulG
MKKETNNILEKRSSEAGVGMIELVIAAVLFLIITGAVFGLMQVARVDRNRASRRSDTLKNARAAMHLIGRDALNAGLSYNANGGFAPDDVLMNRLGLPQDNNSDRDRLTAVIPGNNINTNNLQAGKTDQVSFIYRDMDFNDAETVQLQSVAASPTNSTVPRVTIKPCVDTGTTDPCVTVYDLFLIETSSTQVPVMATAVPSATTVDFAPGDPLGLNQSLTATGNNQTLLKGATVSVMKKFFWVSYKVSSDGTLIRTVFGNNTGGAAVDQIRQQPLAYGIQDMQIRYVLSDGTVADDPTLGTDGLPNTADDAPGNMNLVCQVIITLKVQSNEFDEQTHTTPVITVTSTYATRNIAYDAG